MTGQFKWPDEASSVESFILQNKDRDTLMASSSGGVFSAFAEAVIRRGGIVCGAAYDADGVSHQFADTVEGAAKFRGSKYAQSRIGDAYIRTERELSGGRIVLFSGTPCQTAGLASYLRLKMGSDVLPDNLYMVDLVCHGVGSPKVLRSYLQELCDRGFEVQSLNMRSKHYGYHCGSMELISTDGRKRHLAGRVDEFLEPYYANLIIRPACHVCAFKSYRHASDVTIWDCWNAEEILGCGRSDLGYTNAIVQGQHGQTLMEWASGFLETHRVSFEAIRPTHGGMIMHSSVPNANREAFLRVVDERGLHAANKQFLPKGLRDLVREGVRAALNSLGLLDVIRRGRKEGGGS